MLLFFFYISVRDKIGPIFQNSIPVTGFLLSSFRRNVDVITRPSARYLKDLKKKQEPTISIFV